MFLLRGDLALVDFVHQLVDLFGVVIPHVRAGTANVLFAHDPAFAHAISCRRPVHRMHGQHDVPFFILFGRRLRRRWLLLRLRLRL